MEPYQPSNGTEGAIFDDEWCSRCERDRMFREDMDSYDGCPILADALAYNVDEPQYPKEWVRIKAVAEDGLPVNCGVCTAFVEIGDTIPVVDERTLDLFAPES